MSCQHTHGTPLGFQSDINRPARFAAWNAEIQSVNSPDGKARKQRVAIMPVSPEQRRAGDGRVSRVSRQFVQDVQCGFGTPLEFLKREDVSIDLVDDGAYAGRIVPPVAANAAMDVIGGDNKPH
jgi:hypothetical protein